MISSTVDAELPFIAGALAMMRPDAKMQKFYLHPKPVDFRKSINGLTALVELDIKVESLNPGLFVFFNRTRSQVKILYWEPAERLSVEGGPVISSTRGSRQRDPVPTVPGRPGRLWTGWSTTATR